MRPWHILRPVKGESVPDRLLVFQIEPRHRLIEGRLHEHTFRLGAGVVYKLTNGSVTTRAETVFQSREDWFRWVDCNRDRRRSTWVYSYGLVYGLTLLAFWRALGPRGESVLSAVLSDPPSIVLTRSGRHVTRYVDIANYQRDGLRSMLRGAGADSPSPLSVGSSDADATDYCLSKTLAVGDYLCQAIRLVRSNRFCAWQPTAASLSFATYRHSFLSTGPWIHDHKDALSLERGALFGGRVQMWASGSVNRPVTIVDCNSLYPAVMRDYPHPVKFRNIQSGGTVRELNQAVRGYWCVAQVRLGARAADLPVRRDGRVGWNSKPGDRVLCGAELRQACALGAVRKVYALARYDCGFPFTEFVDTLFSLKLRLQKEQNYGQASFVKLVLNSLHGKFAQKGRKWKSADRAPSQGVWRQWWGRHPENSNLVSYRDLGGYVQYLEEAGEWHNSFPGLSASVTSAARVELARTRNVAGINQTLYCDTDSLHVVEHGHDRLAASNLLHPTDLGKWKTVHTGEDAYYHGLKHYRVGNKYCCCYLTASAWQVQDGVYRDASRLHFGHLLSCGLPDAVYYKERVVRVRDVDQAERLELVGYDEVA